MGKGIKPNGIYLRSLDPRILQESGDLGSRFLLISVTFGLSPDWATNVKRDEKAWQQCIN